MLFRRHLRDGARRERPDGYYVIGGDPLLLIEDEVPSDASIGDLSLLP